MKKVRNLLILLLATLMLTVFVGCSNETKEPPAPEPEPEVVKVGELSLTKIYFDQDSKDKDADNKYALRDYKFFAITNTGSEDVALNNYYMINEQETAVYANPLPEITLKPGVSLYVLNGFKPEAIKSRFPKIKESRTAQASETLDKDALWTEYDIHSTHDGSLLIAKDVKFTTVEEKEVPTEWTTVDTILIDGKNPTFPLAAIRDYNAETKVDSGWKVLDWADQAAIVAALDMPVVVREDYSYATFKNFIPSITDGLKASVHYVDMNEEERTAFVEAAAQDGYKVTFEDDKIYLEKPEGVFMGQTSWGQWNINDFTFETFKNSVKPEELATGKVDSLSKIPYCYMPTSYKESFCAKVTEAGWTLTPAYKKVTLKVGEKEFQQDNKGNWTVILKEPKKIDRHDSEYIPGDQGIVITSIYCGTGKRFCQVTNITDKPIAIKGYAVCQRTNINADKPSNKYSNLPDVTLGPNCSIYIGNEDPNSKNNNGKLTAFSGFGFTNFEKNVITETTTGELNKDAYFYSKNFSPNGNDLIKLTKGNPATLIDEIDCEAKEDLTATDKYDHQLKKCPHTTRIYVRTLSEDKTKYTGWDIYSVNDTPQVKVMNDAFKLN